MKWVLAVSQNNERGIPAINATLLLNDPVTGVPTAILDAGPITAERTAATSGVAIRAWAPVIDGRAPGSRSSARGSRAGATCRSSGTCCPACGSPCSTVTPRAPRRSPRSRARSTGSTAAAVAPDARAAVAGADVVVTAASFVAPPERQVMTGDWLGPETLVVPVDYATYCAASVARDAALFVVDHRDQFLANREAGQFDDYPDPAAMIGEALDATIGPQPAGRSRRGDPPRHGLADVVFGSAILAAAEARGLGTVLPR